MSSYIVLQVLQAMIADIFVDQPPDDMPSFRQVGFEHAGNLTGSKRSKKDLDICRTAAIDARKNRFKVLLICAHCESSS